MKRPLFVFFAIMALAWGIWYDQTNPLPSSMAVAKVDPLKDSVLGKLLLASAGASVTPPPEKPLSLQLRTKTSDCEVRGPLPDPACTPGAVFATATSGQICVRGYSKSVRAVSISLKRTVYAEYGLKYPQKSGAYEADHFIPLELGGSNEIANLFPEAASPTPGFHEKDLVENYLHNEVCAGRLPLSNAQQEIADDWLTVYNSLTPEQIAALRSQYSSYGN